MKITLCGSARFEAQFHEWNENLTMAGYVVYSLAVYPSSKKGNKDWYTLEEKTMLDLVHLAKIMHSDAIVVLNVGKYVGESTRREIEWARVLDKEIYWLEADRASASIDALLPQRID